MVQWLTSASPADLRYTDLEILKKKSSSHGGGRPGAGRPKGSKNASTVDREAARDRLTERVYAELDPLIDAQLANARGIKYLVVRNKKTGKFVRVTQAMARRRQEALKADEEIIEVWEKDACVQAFTDLLNRTLGKPVDAIDLTSSDGSLSPMVIHWLNAVDVCPHCGESLVNEPPPRRA